MIFDKSILLSIPKMCNEHRKFLTAATLSMFTHWITTILCGKLVNMEIVMSAQVGVHSGMTDGFSSTGE